MTDTISAEHFHAQRNILNSRVVITSPTLSEFLCVMGTLDSLADASRTQDKVTPPPPFPDPKSKAEKPAKDEPKAEAQTATPSGAPASAQVAAEPSPAKTPADASPSPAPTAEPIQYDTLRQAVMALATKSRDAAAAVNAAFGVKTMKDLPEARWSEALTAVRDKLAELEAA